MQAGSLTGPAKLAAVTELIGKLKNDLNTGNLLPNQRDTILEELKLYGRDPRNADPIFSPEGIETLSKHAFYATSSTTSRNALRVLCNALLLKAETRQIFVDLDLGEKACEKLKNDNWDDEFLVSRLLFLSTYAKANLKELVDKHHLADIISKALERHVDRRNSTEKPAADAMEEMAMVETMKLIFNITHFCEDRVSLFTPTIPHIVTILCKGNFKSSKPLDPPVGPLVNSLLNLQLGDEGVRDALYPPDEPGLLATRLVDLLAQSKTAYNNGELENTVTPLVGDIRAIYQYAPEAVKASIRAELLPTEADRGEVLGQSSSLASWLLRNTTNALTPEFRRTIAELLFDMSDKDAQKFVDNVGYGFASGFLFNKNIPVPQSSSDALSDSSITSRPVNPVTGQFLDTERQPDGPEMTDEEKEREAERLFVLFERLRANGVISVENPVRTAQQAGRFEELPDDYEDDRD
ncbi:guanine nucleotide exchange factor, Ric8 [Xylariales sp. PMI_506]|nr:guanine nucleotide exchange factor, Ric8 [Xylariales sp. PMI_506]